MIYNTDNTIYFDLLASSSMKSTIKSRPRLCPNSNTRYPFNVNMIKLTAPLIWYMKYFFLYILFSIYPPIVLGY